MCCIWLASKADASPPGPTLAIGDGKIAPTKWGNQTGIAGPLPFANGLDCHVFAASHALACRPGSASPLEGFAYPYPVQMFVIQGDAERLSMAYTDVPPERAMLQFLHDGR